jgi:hypothetical protein
MSDNKDKKYDPNEKFGSAPSANEMQKAKEWMEKMKAKKNG